MAYFKIGSTDYSAYVSALSVGYKHNYTGQTNAAGNTVVDYINKKREVEVEIISLDDTTEAAILTAIDGFSVTIYFLEPKTKTLTSISCIVKDYSVEYYTIQTNNVRFKKFKLKFVEL